MRLTGRDAVTYARAHGLTLSTHADPTATARDGVSVEDALAILREDPSLVFITIASEQLADLAYEAAYVGDEALADACSRICDGAGSEEDHRVTARALVSAAAAAVE
jgi:hypothetical protein